MKLESLRKAYGDALVELGAQNQDVVALEADLGKSTMSCLFQDAYPHRYFEMGIAEQDMMSTAAGLALAGKIPFASTFAVFISGRAYDQIRQTISIGKLNVNICGSSSGLSDFGDGSTHQAVEDAAIMRAIPNMTVLVPVDAVQMRQMVFAAAKHPGPVYFRVNRNDLPVYTGETDTFEIGKAYAMREGSDIAVFANGVMVSAALEAAERLEKESVSVAVINVCSLKPLDEETILTHARRCRGVVTAEEHSVIGGLGSAVAECLRMESIPIDFVGVQDQFGTSAQSYEELMAHYGLTADAVVDAVKRVLAKKNEK